MLILSGVCFLLFVLLMVLLRLVDVQPIGPLGSEVGFASVNGAVRDAIGNNEFFYTLTQIMGYSSFSLCALFGGLGALQLFKRKSLKKVDADLLLLGGFYVVMLACYVLFNVVVINYRPMLEDGELAASFPSSHSVLGICLMLSTLIQIRRRIERKGLRVCLSVLAAAIAVLMLVCRMFSGVHWFTDIVGGALLSLALVSLYAALCEKFAPRGKEQ